MPLANVAGLRYSFKQAWIDITPCVDEFVVRNHKPFAFNRECHPKIAANKASIDRRPPLWLYFQRVAAWHVIRQEIGAVPVVIESVTS